MINISYISTLLLFIININISIESKTYKFELFPSAPLTETEYIVTSSDFLSKLKKRLPLLKTCLGSPKQCFYFALDTNLHMTLLQQKGITPEVFNQTFNIHESSSYKEETQGFPFIYLFKKVSSAFSKDTVTLDPVSYSIGGDFDNIHLNDFPFAIINEELQVPSLELGGYIGLMRDYHMESYDELNENYSLAYYLAKQKELTHKSFMLNYHVSRLGIINGGVFVVGVNYKEDSKYKACSSNIHQNRNDLSWHCYMNNFKLGNTDIPFETKVSFFSAYPLVSLPKSPGRQIFDMMREKSNKQCHIFSQKSCLYFVCDTEYDLNNFDNIDICFENDNCFSFTPIYMFTRIFQDINGKYFNLFKVIVHLSDDMNVILGYPAFINNDIVFDYDRQEVGMVSNVIHKKITKNENIEDIMNKEFKKKMYYVFICLISLISILGCAMLVYAMDNSSKEEGFELDVSQIVLD